MKFPFPHLLRHLLCGLMLAVGLQVTASMAADTSDGLSRPKVGLVLAGGGAKGGAHVGVLKMLERWHIPVDVIAGTSMGAVVGGLYAAGKSPDEIEQEILRIDWNNIFEDSPQRSDKSFRRKTDDRLYFFKAKPGFRDGELQVPRAYVQGQKFDLELKRILGGMDPETDFDRLPIPFRAVAADLESGEAVVLDKGFLTRAIRASMAVPGAFEPVEIEGRLLVDGGIVNNIPVDVARQMGADILIVSDLGSDLLSRDQLQSGLDVASQMVNFLFGLNSQKSLASLKTSDILITNELGDIGSAGFDRIAETVLSGEQAAQQRQQALLRLAVPEPQYLAWQSLRRRLLGDPLVVDFIRVSNRSRIDDEIIRKAIRQQPGDRLDQQQLQDDLQQVYGLDIFQSVRYELVNEQDRTGLNIIAEEKSWGPDYLQAGVIASTDLQGEAAFRLGLAYTRTQINSLNGEMRLAAQLGDEPGLFAELYQPVDSSGDYFVSLTGGYRTSGTHIYDNSGKKTSELFIGGPVLDLGFGRQFGNWGQIKLGYFRQTGEADVKAGQSLTTSDFDAGEIYLRLADDKLDSLYFPTSGHAGLLKWTVSSENLGADQAFQQVDLGYSHAFNFGNNTLVGSAVYRSTVDDTTPYQSLFRLGGFASLSGYEADELAGQHAGLVRGVFMHKLLNSMFFESYAGVTLEAGNVWQDKSDIGWDDTVLAGSLFLGADTPIGPVYLSYGRNDQDRDAIYLIIGPPFSF